MAEAAVGVEEVMLWGNDVVLVGEVDQGNVMGSGWVAVLGSRDRSINE
jgi:hypothetical protein